MARKGEMAVENRAKESCFSAQSGRKEKDTGEMGDLWAPNKRGRLSVTSMLGG